jgi:Flp pilus assembly pilin Flp
MANLIRAFWACESGAAAVEYGVIATAMFLALIPAFIYVAAAMEIKYTSVTSFFNGF